MLTAVIDRLKFMVVLGLVGGLIGPVSSVNADTLSLFHGSITNRYRFRTTGALRDQDLETLLTFNLASHDVDRCRHCRGEDNLRWRGSDVDLPE